MAEDPPREFGDGERQVMLQLARDAIAHELHQYVALSVDPLAYPEPLRRVRATFVTLQIAGRLRGCIGTLEAHRPLVVDVARNAGAAAFADPRFPRLGRSELDQIDIHISVLSPARPMQFTSEADLLGQLRPGVDGLILSDGRHRGTFLPAVWEQLSGAEQFLHQLKQKAGLPPDHWSDTIAVARYTTESFP